MAARDTYIVTGGSGMVGRHVVEGLLARGDAVSCFDIVQRHHDVPFYHGDMSEEGVFLDALKKSGATAIFHVASPRYESQPNHVYEKMNVGGAQEIIAAARACGVTKLVFTSSSGIVFDGGHLENIDETHPIPAKHVDAYNASKAAAERVVLDANGHGGLSTVALRPSTVFGPGDGQFIHAFQDALDKGRDRIQFGANTNLTDWTYIDNVTQAHLLAMDVLGPERPDVAGQAFFITNDEPIPFWDFARKVYPLLRAAAARSSKPPEDSEADRLEQSSELACKPPIVLPAWLAWLFGLVSEIAGWLKGTPPTMSRYRMLYFTVARYHNITKAKNALGYRPTVSVDEGVKRMVDWWVATGKEAHTVKTLH